MAHYRKSDAELKAAALAVFLRYRAACETPEGPVSLTGDQYAMVEFQNGIARPNHRAPGVAFLTINGQRWRRQYDRQTWSRA